MMTSMGFPCYARGSPVSVLGRSHRLVHGTRPAVYFSLGGHLVRRQVYWSSSPQAWLHDHEKDHALTRTAKIAPSIIPRLPRV